MNIFLSLLTQACVLDGVHAQVGVSTLVMCRKSRVCIRRLHGSIAGSCARPEMDVFFHTTPISLLQLLSLHTALIFLSLPRCLTVSLLSASPPFLIRPCPSCPLPALHQTLLLLIPRHQPDLPSSVSHSLYHLLLMRSRCSTLHFLPVVLLPRC